MRDEGDHADSDTVSEILSSQSVPVRSDQGYQIGHRAENFALGALFGIGIDQLGIEIFVLEGQDHVSRLRGHAVAVFLFVAADRLQTHRALGVAAIRDVAVHGHDLAGVENAAGRVGFDLLHIHVLANKFEV